MARLQPTPTTVKRLFALSGNLCAFPGCTQKLVDEADNLTVEICHIEAAEPGGERFNASQTDEERRSFANLILLCANHHKVTNDVTKYSVEVLKEMKTKHESLIHDKVFVPSDDLIRRALRQITDEAKASVSNVAKKGNVSFSNQNSKVSQQIGYQQITASTVNIVHSKDKPSGQSRSQNPSSSRGNSKPQTNREAVKIELRQNLLKQVKSEVTLAKRILWLQIGIIGLAGLSLLFYTADEFSPLAIVIMILPLIVFPILYFQAGSVLRGIVEQAGFEDLPIKDQLDIRRIIKDDAKIGLWFWDGYTRGPLDRALRVEKKPRWRRFR